ncbi:MAG: ferrous iron transporter B [Thermoanaerobaculia bacterium]|nr:ferrous iron transporter B [Thermoanaerobaculia bacterium]
MSRANILPFSPSGLATPDLPPPIVLVGNPNVGKSLLFRPLTQKYVTVSNYPGTTVEIFEAKATVDGCERSVIDTPGINDLDASGEESRVTRRLLGAHPEALVVQVADAKNLRRALVLTQQLTELEQPMVLVLNMCDELEERGGKIDAAKLEDQLGVAVVRTVATTGSGTLDLVRVLGEGRVPVATAVETNASSDDSGREIDDSRRRLARANEILAETYSIESPPRAAWKVRLGFWAMHPVKGMVFLAVILMTFYWVVGLVGAGSLVDGMEIALFEQRLNPLAIRTADAILPFPHRHEVEVVPYEVSLPVSPVHEVTLTEADRLALRPSYVSTGPVSGVETVLRFVHDLLVGPYGTITMALTYALAIVLPIVTLFFLAFGILEDSGYFPRMAILLNRSFRAIGLNGKAVLPMILGLGCTTMATMTTRVLETRKERIVTTTLLALAVPCSAQLGVLLALMAALSPSGTVVWLAVMTAVILLVGWLTAKVFPGETSDFLLEIPPMRRPMLANVLAKTRSRLAWYLREVIPIFVVGTAVLFLLDRLTLLERFARWGEPVIRGWLGLPAEMSNAFLVGFMRRDFGAVYVLDAVSGPAPLLDPHQILVAMVTITLFMPCFATLLMVAREHGAKVAAAITAFIFPFAFLVGGLVNQIGRWLTS